MEEMRGECGAGERGEAAQVAGAGLQGEGDAAAGAPDAAPSEDRRTPGGGAAVGRSWASALFTVAFLSPWVPCFLRGGLLDEAHLAFGPFNAFASALPVGCLVVAALALLVPGLRMGCVAKARPVLIAGATAYAIGFVLLAAACAASATVLAAAAGALAGVGVVPVGVWWCSRTRAAEFSQMLLRGALVGLGVFVVARLATLLSAEGCALVWADLALIVAAWTARCTARERDVPGDGPRSAGAPVASDLFSARSAFSVIATAALGLVPFVLMGNILPGVTIGTFTFDSSTGLLVGSLLTLVIAAFARRKRSIAPTLFWTVFPVCAGVLVVLLAFPKESFASTLSAGLAFAFFSMIGVFAVVCCAHVVAQREFPAALVAAPPFVLAALASVAANLLSGVEATSDESGAALMVVAMAYFVLVMLAPAFQLRRQRQADHEEAGSAMSEEGAGIAFDEACAVLADRHGLSKREREVFGYLVQGYTSPYIAKALFISDSTVRSHTKSIYRKFEASSRTNLIEIVRRFAEEGDTVAGK